MPKTFVLHDDSLNTSSFRMLTDGADLSQLERNPVMFFYHSDYQLPIGRWENIRKEGTEILADAVFDLDDPEAAKIAGKVDRDFLRMASIGAWPPIEISDDPALKLPGQQYPTVTRWLAREASIVPIGANHNAIRLYDRDGNLLNTTDPAAFISLADNYSPKPKTMKKIILLLNAISGLQLVDTATEDEVAVKLNDVVSTNTRFASENQTLQTRVDELTSAETTRQKTGFIALIDAAVKSGRMSASGRDAMLNLFDKDPQNAATALEALPVPQSVTRQIEKANQNGQNNTELSDITAKDWNTLDKEGKLTTLKDKYPDLYKEKFKTRFGTEPNL